MSFFPERSLKAALVMLSVVASQVHAQHARDTDAAVHHFEQNIATYLALRDRAATTVSPLAVTPNAGTLEDRVNELAKRIRMARRDAHSGDIFSLDVGRAFRRLIRTAMQRHATTSAALLANINDDAYRINKRALAVNEQFPWNVGSEVPEELLEVLPDLPDKLEYKFVNTELLLVDVEADLIIDVLSNVVERE